jgi:hypothetical protein
MIMKPNTPIPVHGFWSVAQDEIQDQIVEFMKNITIMGGFLYMIAFGAGEISLDAKRARRSKVARCHPSVSLSEEAECTHTDPPHPPSAYSVGVAITHALREVLALRFAEGAHDEKRAY